jgi:hypothetical protein
VGTAAIHLKANAAKPFEDIGAPDRIDQNSPWAVLTLRASRLRRSVASCYRNWSNNVRLLGRDTAGKQEGAPAGPLLVYWRARQDSNL